MESLDSESEAEANLPNSSMISSRYVYSKRTLGIKRSVIEITARSLQVINPLTSFLVGHRCGRRGSSGWCERFGNSGVICRSSRPSIWSVIQIQAVRFDIVDHRIG
jgi:hypothetical protein